MQPQNENGCLIGGLIGCLSVFGVFVLIIVVGIPLFLRIGDRRQNQARERLLAQEDNVLRYDGDMDSWREIQEARRVGHEVDIDRYRPFSPDNSLVVMRETPTITFTEDFPRLDGATSE